jgi:carbamoyltransferase
MIIYEKEVAAEMLTQQKIVAIFQGDSEWGPRALGNRSILFDPRNPDAKKIINEVKRREWFRPFAGTILLEHVHDYFEMLTLKESPYMTFAIQSKQKAKDTIPGVIHVDGTCRIQTVTKEQNKNFYELIECFYQKTGVPVLFNTSFNLGGETMVETLEDAISTIKRSKIDYLYLPNQEQVDLSKH